MSIINDKIGTSNWKKSFEQPNLTNCKNKPDHEIGVPYTNKQDPLKKVIDKLKNFDSDQITEVLERIYTDNQNNLTDSLIGLINVGLIKQRLNNTPKPEFRNNKIVKDYQGILQIYKLIAKLNKRQLYEILEVSAMFYPIALQTIEDFVSQKINLPSDYSKEQ
jgi:hypothetical protein